MAKIKEGVLGKIKLMTGEQMAILNNDSFNQEVESLKRRVEQVECTKIHKEIAQTLLKEVSELERHVNALMAFQGEASVSGGSRSCSSGFQATVNLPPGIHILPKIPLSPEPDEEFEDPPQNPKTKRGSRAKSKGDCTVMDPYRK